MRVKIIYLNNSFRYVDGVLSIEEGKTNVKLHLPNDKVMMFDKRLTYIINPRPGFGEHKSKPKMPWIGM